VVEADVVEVGGPDVLEVMGPDVLAPPVVEPDVIEPPVIRRDVLEPEVLEPDVITVRSSPASEDESAISRLLADVQRSLDRVEPEELAAVQAAGALVVDMRPLEQRERDGELPGAVVVCRNVLEWRLDPSSPHRLPIADDPGRRIVLVCNEGYSSSLAAHTLQQLGLVNATDLTGGFQAWLALQRRAH
jgi:rhodanese-related sulfurtransferase